MFLILDETKKMGVTLIIDEAFIDFTDDEEAFSMVNQLSTYKHLIILKSLTKFYAIPGLRLGYFLSSDTDFVKQVKSNRIPWVINSIVEKAGVLSLNDKDYIKATKSFVLSERKFFIDALSALEALEVFPSQGNYVFFRSQILDLHVKLEEYGIMIRNCDNYQGLNRGYYRVAIKSRDKNKMLIQSLNEILL